MIELLVYRVFATFGEAQRAPAKAHVEKIWFPEPPNSMPVRVREPYIALFPPDLEYWLQVKHGLVVTFMGVENLNSPKGPLLKGVAELRRKPSRVQTSMNRASRRAMIADAGLEIPPETDLVGSIQTSPDFDKRIGALALDEVGGQSHQEMLFRAIGGK